MDRWNGIERLYTEEDVEQLRGTIHVEHTLARLGAERLWQLLQDEDYVAALGAMTGRPGGADGQGRPEGDLPLAAGRSRPTRTSPSRSIPTRAFTRRRARRRSFAA